MDNIHVPADVPNELIETYLDNMAAATAGTGSMNLFACDQKIEHLNDDFYDGGKTSRCRPTTPVICLKSVPVLMQTGPSACSPVSAASSPSTLETTLTCPTS